MAFLYSIFVFFNYFYWADEYSLLFHYFIVVSLFIIFLWFLVINLSYSTTLFEKTSQYECGFEPFGYNSVFDLQYFLIGVLYLVFDVELVLLIPWVFCYSVMSLVCLLSMFFFVLFAVVLIYEWKKKKCITLNLICLFFVMFWNNLI